MRLQEIISQADVAAGLSLGEYTALTFAGALKYVFLAGRMSIALHLLPQKSPCTYVPMRCIIHAELPSLHTL